MAEKPEPYDLAPENPPSPPAPPLPGAAPGASKPKLEAPRLLDEFEPDADFNTDPELERVVAGKSAAPVAPVAPAEAAVPRPEFIPATAGEPKIIAGIGLALLVGALIATAITTTSKAPIAATLLTLYNGLVHSGTGIVAVYLAAFFSERRVTRPDQVAARMFVPVAAYALVFHLRINVFLLPMSKTEETIAAAAVYLAVVAGLLRLWGSRLMLVVGIHLLLWLIVGVGMALAAYVDTQPSAPPPAPPV